MDQVEDEALGEVDVVGPVLNEDQAGGVVVEACRRHLVGQVAGRPGRAWALPVEGPVVRGVGHRSADRQLVADQVAIGGPHGHVEA